MDKLNPETQKDRKAMDKLSPETQKDRKAMDKLSPEPQRKDRKSPGVAESGVLIRKTSIRRRISKDETTEDKTFGNKTEEYDKICKRTMADNGVKQTLEALQDKWKMIMFMYEDCMDLRKSKADEAKMFKKRKMKREFIALLITYVLITVPILITLYLAVLFVIWFVTTAS